MGVAHELGQQPPLERRPSTKPHHTNPRLNTHDVAAPPLPAARVPSLHWLPGCCCCAAAAAYVYANTGKERGCCCCCCAHPQTPQPAAAAFTSPPAPGCGSKGCMRVEGVSVVMDGRRIMWVCVHPNTKEGGTKQPLLHWWLARRLLLRRHPSWKSVEIFTLPGMD